MPLGCCLAEGFPGLSAFVSILWEGPALTRRRWGAGLVTDDLGKELGFLRKLVLKGSWESAETFLRPLQVSSL